jgi:hypothetical protein
MPAGTLDEDDPPAVELLRVAQPARSIAKMQVMLNW